jgi:carbamoyl-phosphate synthase large subunit
VIRALKEAASFDARIIGLSYESLEPGIYMHDIVDRSYSIPYPSAGIDTLLARLEYIHDKEKLDVIIPNFDAELYPFIKLEPKLKSMGIHMFLPTLDQFEERQKINLNEFGKKFNIKVPNSKVLHDLSTAFSLQSEFSFPMIVKGKFYDASRNLSTARNLT